MIAHLIARLLTAFAPNFYMFIAGRFLLAMVAMGWYTVIYVFGKGTDKANTVCWVTGIVPEFLAFE